MVCPYCRVYYPNYARCNCAGARQCRESVIKAKTETVNHPPHYTFGRYEVIDVLEDWFVDEPHLWQVGKYIARAARKGDELEDLKKARWYLNRKIEKLEQQKK